MIVAHRRQLEAICRQRGYDLTAAMACVVSQDGDMWTIDETHAAYPRRRRQPLSSQPQTPPRRDGGDDLTWAKKAQNFAVAAAKHVAAGMPLASEEEIIRRHDICLSCEFLKNSACTKCGCPVVRERKYVSKLSWADSSCPVGKW